VALSLDSTHPAAYFGAFTDEVLAEKAAIVVFLKAQGYTQDKLKTITSEDQYNTLIHIINSADDVPVDKLNKLSVADLLEWGWDIKGGTAGAIAAAA